MYCLCNFDFADPPDSRKVPAIYGFCGVGSDRNSDSCFPGNEFQERGEAEEVNPERKERFTRTVNFRSACLIEEENKSVD